MSSVCFGSAALLYQEHCAKCHGDNRLGKTAPPLTPEILKSKTDNELFKIIKNGLKPTPMPAFGNLTPSQIISLVKFIKTPVQNMTWNIKDIKTSRKHNIKPNTVKPFTKSIVNIMAVVEAGKNDVWIMNGLNIINKVKFGDIHGGLKFSQNGKYIYMPSRNGYIGRYNIQKGYLDYLARACIYQRNIGIVRDYILSACWLPQQIIIFSKSLKPIKVIPINGQISAIYGLYTKPEAIFGFMHKNTLGFLNVKSFKISYYKTDVPFEDFFIDPLEYDIVGSSFSHNLLEAFDIDKHKIVYKTHFSGMPHLASAAWWYKDGNFYFATPDIRKSVISIWRAYRWKKIREIPTKGPGFFVKTHPNTPYLWADEGSNTLLVINKNTFAPKHIRLVNKGWILHTQLSGDGKYAYVSDYTSKGKLFVLDSTTLKPIKIFKADKPLGKYNYVTYSNSRQAALLGEEVYLRYCWGCHHPTRTAFAPSFKYIYKHVPMSMIKAQILNPETTYKILGFKQNVMPKFHLTKYELRAILMFIRYSADKNFWSSQ